jgi:hypothetical protein
MVKSRSGRKNRVTNRKSRCAGRKSRTERKSRSGRKSRTERKSRSQRGGNPMLNSLKQGMNYLENAPIHRGGMAPYPGSVGDTLPENLRGSAHLLGQDQAYAAIAGMQDGGRRHRRSSRKQRGGMAPLSEPDMLLPADLEARAGLHPEWTTAGM